jgi:hypothetical protein
MKACGGVNIYIYHIFLTSALVGGEWSASLPGRFTPRESAPGTHWIGGWVDPRAGLDDVEKRKSRPYRDSNSDPSVVQPVAPPDYPRRDKIDLACERISHEIIESYIYIYIYIYTSIL